MVGLHSNDRSFVGHLLHGGPKLGTRTQMNKTHRPCPGTALPPVQRMSIEHLLCVDQCKAPGHRDEGSTAPAPGKLRN